ncbi:MAG: alpha/beta hydrolase [Microcystaceae cyanobacterium]
MLIPKSSKLPPSLSLDIYPPQPTYEEDQNSLVIIIFQGVEIDKAEYSTLATELSKYQFWVIVPNCFPVGRDYLCPENDSLLKVISTLKNSDSKPLNQALERGIILFGHSAGGMAAFGTLENHQLTALKAIATYGSNAPLLTKMLTSLPPVLMLSGEKDAVVSPNVSRLAFKKLPATKTFIELMSLNHYSINNSTQPIAAPLEQELAGITNQAAIKLIVTLLQAFAQTLQSPQKDWLNHLDDDIVQLIRSSETKAIALPNSL